MEISVTSASLNKGKPASFKDIQYQFTRHIRDPELHPAPVDIEGRRMQIYRELLYNNVEDFIANTFPVLRKITPDLEWHAMLRDYFKNHKARTPLFPKMSQEFLQYLDNEREIGIDKYPFIKELAHYEWLELAISIDSRNIESDDVDINGDLLKGVPVLSPLAWPFVYQFPVHKISPDYLPQEPPPQASYLIVYRDREDDIGFQELNPVSARLVEYLQSDKASNGLRMLEEIAAEIKHPNPQVVIDGGLEILQSMRDKAIILGVRKIDQ
jgi:uncharacterized protein